MSKLLDEYKECQTVEFCSNCLAYHSITVTKKKSSALERYIYMSAEQLCKGRYSQTTEILPGKTESRPRTFSVFYFIYFLFLYFLQLYNLCVVKQTETSLKVKNKILMSSHSYSYSKFVHGQQADGIIIDVRTKD